MARTPYNNEILTEDQKVAAIDALLPIIGEHAFFKPHLLWLEHANDLNRVLLLENGIYPDWPGLNEAFLNRNIAKFIDGAEGKFLLTDFGREVKNAGGILLFKKKQEETKEAEKKRQELSDEKLRSEVTNLRRIKRTYWWTFAFSIIALVISGALLIVKVFFDK